MKKSKKSNLEVDPNIKQCNNFKFFLIHIHLAA
jgi:hypothetical protein